MIEDEDPDGEWTRMRAKLQIGDGPDQRGDTTVEMVRLTEEKRDTTADIELPDGTVVEDVDVNNAQFAEFFFELSRASQALREALGLPQDE